MSSSESHLQNIKQQFENLKDEQSRVFEMFEELTAFQIRLAGFSSLSTQEDLYIKLLDILATAIDFTFARVLRSEEGTQIFRVAYERGVPDELSDKLEVDPTLLRWAIDEGQVSFYPVEDPEISGVAKSLIIIPLVGQREVLGAAALWIRFPSEELSQHVYQMLTIFSKEVANAMENLDLYLRTQSLTYLLDNTIESVPHAIMVFGLDDRIIACNKNAEFLFGFKRFFALEERYQDVLPKEVSNTFSSLILSTLEGRVEIDQEMDYSLDARTSLTLGISSSLLTDKEGQPRGVLFICRDMSLSREVEKLRELDLLKTEFIHTVSHELKTPLTAIMSGTEILMSDKDQLSEEQQEILGIVDEASSRLQALLIDILDMSKLEDGEMRIDKEWSSLEEMVSATGTMLVTASSIHQLVLDCEKELPPVCIDAPKVTQVLENIVGNAIKYSPEGGEIKISVRDEGNEIVVTVADSGVGVPIGDMNKIWDKFHRADLAMQQQIEGTGLGLSIAKHIMELHDGEITVASEEGVGSTFSIHFPIRKSTNGHD